METPFINRVAESGIVTIDLKEYYVPGKRILYDLKDNLYEGLILREKDFRAFLKSNDWTKYTSQYVAITCTADAIIPQWAYMLLNAALQPYAARVIVGDLQTLETVLILDSLQKINVETFRDKRVVIKGCGDVEIPPSAFGAITSLLMPVAQSIMYGEPCSTVPVYKRK
ncbi:MAG: DUF2480 family protein [Bacteroidetes bacterium]|nr:DUF2480 family protein [Bacteroidota bacterium]